MPLPVTEVERELLHTRRIRYEGYKRADGLWDIEAHLTDIKNHDYQLKTGVRRVLRRRALSGRLRARVPPPRGIEPRASVREDRAGAAGRRARLHPPHRDALRDAHRRGPVLRRRDEGRGGRRLAAFPARPVPRARDDERNGAALVSQMAQT